ncbi:hypothetical protein ACFQ0M_15175 [Kitasatospora aburaviensis]
MDRHGRPVRRDVPLQPGGDRRHPYSEELSVALADPGQRGRYLAVYQLSWNLGQAVAPGLLTLLLGHGAAWPWLFLLVVSLTAVPGLLRLERVR